LDNLSFLFFEDSKVIYEYHRYCCVDTVVQMILELIVTRKLILAGKEAKFFDKFKNNKMRGFS